MIPHYLSVKSRGVAFFGQKSSTFHHQTAMPFNKKAPLKKGYSKGVFTGVTSLKIERIFNILILPGLQKKNSSEEQKDRNNRTARVFLKSNC